jgi:cobaltochelatase CobT
MPDTTPLDRFRGVLTGTARAIARDPEVEVAFASEAGAQGGRVARGGVAGAGPSAAARGRGTRGGGRGGAAAPPP